MENAIVNRLANALGKTTSKMEIEIDVLGGNESMKLETSPKKSPLGGIIQEVPAYLAPFDVANDSFKFGAIGLYNTPREQCFYKIKARFCN